MWHWKFDVTSVTSHTTLAKCCSSHVACHRSLLICHMEPVNCHTPHVTSHLPHGYLILDQHHLNKKPSGKESCWLFMTPRSNWKRDCHHTYLHWEKRNICENCFSWPSIVHLKKKTKLAVNSEKEANWLSIQRKRRIG